MSKFALQLYIKAQNLLTAEEGQDLIEYGLLVSLIALAAITGIGYVTSAVTTLYNNISTSI